MTRSSMSPCVLTTRLPGLSVLTACIYDVRPWYRYMQKDLLWSSERHLSWNKCYKPSRLWLSLGSTCQFLKVLGVILDRRLTFEKPYTMVGKLAVDGCTITFGTARRAWVGCGHAQSPLRCTKCNSLPINGQCTNFILPGIWCDTIITFAL